MASVFSVLITIIAAILIFGVVIFIHELGHFVAAKKSGVKVNEFALGMGPAIFKKKKGETTYSLRLFPMGGFVSMEGEDSESNDERSFQKAKLYKRIIIVAAGAIMNLILGFIVLIILVSSLNLVPTRTIAKFDENAKSEQTGLQVGDTIVAVNGRRCFVMDDVSYEFIRIKDGSAEFTVIRDDKEITIPNVSFNTEHHDDVGDVIIQDYYLYGTPKTFTSVLSYATNWGISMARMVFLSLFDLITGNVPMTALSGPVGIVGVISEAASIGWRPVVMFLALISVNLGVFNLLPFPALDGGRLFFLFIEAIRRKPINQKYEGVINVIGFALLICLMLFVTFNDITKLFR